MNETGCPDTCRPHAPRCMARRAMLWAGLLIFLTAGYFQNTRPGWNVNSQFALACALAERGTAQIDRYREQPAFFTRDLAFHDGHYYSDKSPVTALLGVPVVWLTRQIHLALGQPMPYERARIWTTWLVIGGAAAWLAALLAGLLMQRGLPPGRAALAAALWIGATPLLGYSVLFMSYLPTAALLVAGFAAVAPDWRGGTVTPLRRFLGGVALGLAAWSLNTAAVAALVLTAALAVAALQQGGGPGLLWRRLWPWAVGGVIGASGYFIYNQVVFGSIRSPYIYEVDDFFREQMGQGFMGAGAPRLWVAWLLTFHPFQGLFLWFPLALAALTGLGWLVARGKGGDRLEAIVALSVFGLLLVYFSGYFMWWGGREYAPRHLLPGMPLMALGLVPLLKGGRTLRRTVWTIAVLGLILNLGAVAVNPQPPMGLEQDALMHPETVTEWTMPFLQLQAVFWFVHYTDVNWGTRLGLGGPLSLLPLGLIWAGALWALRRWIGPADANPSAD